MKGISEIDKQAIKDKLERGESFEFVKPWFSRSLALGIFWILVISGTYYYMETHWMDTYRIHMLLFFAVPFSFYKVFTSPYKIIIKGDIVTVHTYHPMEPVKEYRFSRMTSWAQGDSVFFIQKGKFFSGTDLRRAFWWPHWIEMREVFVKKADYSVGYKDSRTTATGQLKKPVHDRGMNFVLVMKIMFETMSLPYLLLCRAVFGR